MFVCLRTGKKIMQTKNHATRVEILGQGGFMKKKYTRVTAFTIIIGLIFTVLITRLAYIQIINGDMYKNTAEAKGEKQILDVAPRGEILDRNGQKLATNVQSFNVTYSNTNTKLDNDIINNELMETIKIIERNGDGLKLNIQDLPVEIQGNKFAFNFNAKSEELRVKLANNFVKNNNLGLDPLVVATDRKTPAENIQATEDNLTKRARDIFYVLANQFGLTKQSSDNGIKSSSKNKNSKSSDKKVVINYNLKEDLSLDMMQKLIALRLSIRNIGFSQYKTVYIANNVKRETAVAMFYKANTLNGITCEISPMRKYPQGEIGSAFLGYLGKIDQTEADKFTNLGYDISRELVGKMGLEKVLENNNDMNIRLRGEPGFKYVNVDKFGRVLKQVATLDPIPGDTVVTTIDLNLQRVAENALDQTMKDIVSGKIKSDAKYTNANRGAAVVVNVKTGEILALASRPGYDPNWFAATGSVSEAIGKTIFPADTNDPFDLLPKPMFNYATAGKAPPGSTFKPFVAISALQEKDITPEMTIIDRGIYSVVKGFHGACWLWNQSHGTHGVVNLAKALEVSCNYYFFDVGRRLGYTAFQNWASKFGLGSNPQTGEKPTTGIEIGERPGDVSSPYGYKTNNINLIMRDQVVNYLSDIKYGGYNIAKDKVQFDTIKSMFMSGVYDEQKLNTVGIMNPKALRHLKIQINQFDSEANSVGQLLNASIGQGTTELTPIQLVSYISTLVNGGYRYKLHLVKKVIDPNGAVKKEIQPELIDKINLLPENIDAVKAGMRKVTEEGGTASAAFVGFPIPTGGKTGSASVSKGQERHGRSAYGWFIGFAPLDDPQIAVCVVIYDAGHGGSVAPVARAIYNQYFGLNKPATSTINPGTNQNDNNVNIH